MTIIIGAGASGLACARALEEAGQEYIVLEAGSRTGGVIETVRPTPHYQLDYGANTLLADDALFGFLQRAGLGPDWIEPYKETSRARYVLRGHELRKLPSGPLSLLANGFFSWKTIGKVLSERHNARLSSPGESVYSFFERRFGQEVADYAVQPFVSGIYAGDARELAVEHAFPQLLEMEKADGSVLKGMIKAQKRGPKRRTLSFVDGMGSLIEALEDTTRHLHLNTPVESLERKGNGWLVKTAAGNTIEGRRVVITTPAWEAARLLAPLHPDAAARFAHIRYAPVSQVHLAYDKKAIGQSLNGFGALHPHSAGTFTMGAIWVSSLFPMRAPHPEALFCAFAGGVNRPDMMHLSEEEVLSRADEELRRLYRIEAPPTMRHMRRWERGIPQYDSRMDGVVKAATRLKEEGILICANWCGGVSLGDCLRRGIEAVGY